MSLHEQKVCRVCKNPITPTPQQIKKYDWICSECARAGKRAARGPAAKPLREKVLPGALVESREAGWSKAMSHTREVFNLLPGARWSAVHYRAAIDHFDRVWPSTAPLALMTRWLPCPRCAGHGRVDGSPPQGAYERVAALRMALAVTLDEFQALLEWSKPSSTCPECSGTGWLHHPEWHPLPWALAWEIAWLGGTRRQVAQAQGGGLQPWSFVNLALVEWEAKRISPPRRTPEELAKIEMLEGVPRKAKRLADAGRALGSNLRSLSPQGWAVLAKRARVPVPTRQVRERAIELSEETRERLAVPPPGWRVIEE